MRQNGRRPDEMRPIEFLRNFNDRPAGSVLVSFGLTRVLCTAVVEDGVPPFLAGGPQGWLTAEYSMLPGATERRKPREGRTGKPDSRSLEISRLIGRSLRTVVDLKAFRDKTIWLDCDVLRADGGTRTAAISGAYVALLDAIDGMRSRPQGKPVTAGLAAVSVGVVGGRVLLDLDYQEDSKAQVDLNVILTSAGRFVELQGTAETEPFDDAQLQEMLGLARSGIAAIQAAQEHARAT
ncbi:MAG: ribonuclease PH [Planctomycetaceae bacterium]